ncbi:hypothetical protein QQG09_07470 [Melissococcus plutonius]|uniref:hypothetical protein n=1 Tax=Melissococcus plutonius TaxID=33970 RepID=UPI000F82F185|nr:hypothetical protein [Melissococcus plutonius]MBB5176776.1 hypothetical protein [Melissococcus plutonius]MCV2497947.1 hypothetical protein [Melissococcus plutonius]MCV2501638.1 hypothetical protein [Melissococcus plutonius]MCV2505287.1 hypothetical protein [Melissococcus plutonius]MCV2506562.1 hypothetical protein [Melissococcus plutonius]
MTESKLYIQKMKFTSRVVCYLLKETNRLGPLFQLSAQLSCLVLAGRSYEVGWYHERSFLFWE